MQHAFIQALAETGLVERFRHAHRDAGVPGERPAPPVAEALAYAIGVVTAGSPRNAFAQTLA